MHGGLDFLTVHSANIQSPCELLRHAVSSTLTHGLTGADGDQDDRIHEDDRVGCTEARPTDKLVLTARRKVVNRFRWDDDEPGEADDQLYAGDGEAEKQLWRRANASRSLRRSSTGAEDPSYSVGLDEQRSVADREWHPEAELLSGAGELRRTGTDDEERHQVAAENAPEQDEAYFTAGSLDDWRVTITTLEPGYWYASVELQTFTTVEELNFNKIVAAATAIGQQLPDACYRWILVNYKDKCNDVGQAVLPKQNCQGEAETECSNPIEASQSEKQPRALCRLLIVPQHNCTK